MSILKVRLKQVKPPPLPLITIFTNKGYPFGMNPIIFKINKYTF